MPTLLQIAQFGNPILQEPAKAVDRLEDPAVQELIDDMIATTLDVDGVGLAAPQVYHSKRIFIVASRPNARYPYAPLMEPTAMVNPDIISFSPEKKKDWEGCLSAPGVRGLVPRSERVVVRYLSRNGESAEAEFEGFIARIVQHEMDHLDGISFLERMDSIRDVVMEKEFLKIIARNPT